MARAWLLVLALGVVVGGMATVHAEEKKVMGGKVFELRTYYVHPGRMPAVYRSYDCLVDQARDEAFRFLEAHRPGQV